MKGGGTPPFQCILAPHPPQYNPQTVQHPQHTGECPTQARTGPGRGRWDGKPSLIVTTVPPGRPFTDGFTSDFAKVSGGYSTSASPGNIESHRLGTDHVDKFISEHPNVPVSVVHAEEGSGPRHRPGASRRTPPVPAVGDPAPAAAVGAWAGGWVGGGGCQKGCVRGGVIRWCNKMV